jgi:5-methylcytosine-specific restriction enzyme subunit McrC
LTLDAPRIAEYGSSGFLDITLSDRELEFLERKSVKRALKHDFDARGRVKFEANDHVGVLELENFRIVVEPKVAGGRAVLARMLQHLLPTPEHLGRMRAVEFGGETLFDLVLNMLNQEAEDVLRRGVLHDYHQRSDALTAVRGRILPLRQLAERANRWDKVWCRHDVFGTNSRENRLLRDALRAGARRASSTAVRTRAHRAASVFHEACEGTVTTGERHLIVRDRRNAYYWPAVDLAHAVLDGRGIDDIYSAGDGQLHSFFVSMNGLFEKLVERAILRITSTMPGWRATGQAADLSTLRVEPSGKPIEIRPDVVLVGPGSRRVPIDAKYKRYDRKQISSSDAQQLFVYGFANQAAAGEATALLLYPAERLRGDRHIVVVDRNGNPGGRVRVHGVDIRSLLDGLEGKSSTEMNALSRIFSQLIITA